MQKQAIYIIKIPINSKEVFYLDSKIGEKKGERGEDGDRTYSAGLTMAIITSTTRSIENSKQVLEK